MSENFYPPEPSPRRFSIVVASLAVLLALLLGVGIGYGVARLTWRDIEPVPATSSNETTLPGVSTSETAPPALPPTKPSPVPQQGEVLAYRLDVELEGGGTELGDPAAVYMNFGSDVTLYTETVFPDGSADLKFVFDNTIFSGTFLDSPFEMTFQESQPSNNANPTGPPPSPQAEFLTTPIEMRVAANGEVISVSKPDSLKEMLGTVVAVPHVSFPEGELTEGRQWESLLKLPVPGLGDAIDTTITNTLIGVERVGRYECGVVRQQIGAARQNTRAEAPPDASGETMTLSVPLFDLSGENTVYFDLETRRLVHAVLDMQFALRIKEQLGEAGRLIEELLPTLSGEAGTSDLDSLLGEDGAPDLMDLSLTIDGAFSLVNEGFPQPLPGGAATTDSSLPR